MSTMELTVEHLGKGSAMECVTPQGVTMTFDDPDTGDHGASPMQHLLASLGACSLIDIDIILRKKRLEFSDLRVKCVGHRRDEPFPRLFEDVELVFEVSGDVPQDVFDHVVELSVDKYCSAAGTVRHETGVSYSAVVHGE